MKRRQKIVLKKEKIVISVSIHRNGDMIMLQKEKIVKIRDSKEKKESKGQEECVDYR